MDSPRQGIFYEHCTTLSGRLTRSFACPDRKTAQAFQPAPVLFSRCFPDTPPVCLQPPAERLQPHVPEVTGVLGAPPPASPPHIQPRVRLCFRPADGTPLGHNERRQRNPHRRSPAPCPQILCDQANGLARLTAGTAAVPLDEVMPSIQRDAVAGTGNPNLPFVHRRYLPASGLGNPKVLHRAAQPFFRRTSYCSQVSASTFVKSTEPQARQAVSPAYTGS